MVSCPSCHKPVEVTDKHMGTIFTCPHCDAVYFINWDGQPEMANHEEEASVSSEMTSEPATDFGNAGATFDQNYSPEQNSEPSAEQGYQNDQGYAADQGFGANNFGAESAYATEGEPSAQEPQAESIPAASMDYPAEIEVEIGDQGALTGELTEEAPFDFSQTLDYVEPTPAPTVSDDANFGDVLEFANADVESGPLAYTVFIEGIESSQLVHQLRDAMTDSRFGWDVNDLLTQIGGGRLTLKGLSPAKASVLINRIKYLPFKITWRQDVLSGS